MNFVLNFLSILNSGQIYSMYQRVSHLRENVFGVKISDDIFEAEGVFMEVSLGHIFSNNLGIVIGKIYR